MLLYSQGLKHARLLLWEIYQTLKTYSKSPAMLSWHLKFKQLLCWITAKATTLCHYQWENVSFQVLWPLQLLYMIPWLRYYPDTSGVYSQPNTIHTARADSLHHAEIPNLAAVLTEVWKCCFLWYLYWQFAIRFLLLHLSAWLEQRQGCSWIQSAG